MIQIRIDEKDNGYLIDVVGSNKFNGEKVFRSVDVETLVQFLGETLCGYKIKVERR